MPEPIRVKGHGLISEGRAMVLTRYTNGPGRGRCSCGWESEVLPNTRQRQMAHRAHKLDLLSK